MWRVKNLFSTGVNTGMLSITKMESLYHLVSFLYFLFVKSNNKPKSTFGSVPVALGQIELKIIILFLLIVIVSIPGEHN